MSPRRRTIWMFGFTMGMWGATWVHFIHPMATLILGTALGVVTIGMMGKDQEDARNGKS